MQITKRSDAKLAGSTRFFTGEPCKNGHMSERLTVNGACYECEQARKIRSYHLNGGRDKSRERSNRWLAKMTPERRQLFYENQRKKFKDLSEEEKENKRKSAWAKEGLPIPNRPRPDACEICGKKQEQQGRVLCLDHCHDTGQFRGWLCDSCNRGIGMLGDSLASILKVVNYLTTASK